MSLKPAMFLTSALVGTGLVASSIAAHAGGMTHVGTWSGVPGASAALNALNCQDSQFDPRHPRAANMAPIGPINVQRPNANNFGFNRPNPPAAMQGGVGLRGSYAGNEDHIDVQSRMNTPLNVQAPPGRRDFADNNRPLNVENNYPNRPTNNNFNISKPVAAERGIENFRGLNVNAPNAANNQAVAAANAPAARPVGVTGEVPAGMAPYFGSLDWSVPSPVGGAFRWVAATDTKPDTVPTIRGGVITLTAFPPGLPLTLTAEDLLAMDRQIDDGNLATGNFRTGFNGWPVLTVQVSP